MAGYTACHLFHRLIILVTALHINVSATGVFLFFTTSSITFERSTHKYLRRFAAYDLTRLLR